ncbi:putative zinc protease mug138 [Golovinomyces cichoracearum]|uniref:Putative zinc protease mug138 n=1 Tax=Golovinomyces cichoracearum TaxID=62708 RepID=A0A420IJU0_9PEZI|nr:putative zinc protease mug138 [Golovinomyces cichoracearum]
MSTTVAQHLTPSSQNTPPRQERWPIERVTDQLETPSLDDRFYRVIKLHNQLEVLLVHDAGTDKSSAALDVNVGNFSDEENMPGMAHAVEHLLFMGTKKYLSAHSGSSNAYTGATSTNYYFEIAAMKSEDAGKDEPSPLYGALDRFAQFFIEPLFLSSTLDRELQAVDSENKKNLQNDNWRLHQLNKSLSNPKHPYCHFSTGNFEVLKIDPESRGVDVRQKFMDFHEKHYSANRMKLVILGRESLDVLEEWAAELFSGIPNKNLSQNRWEEEIPFRKEDLMTQCFVKPVMDSRSLEISFPIIDEEYLFETQPSNYLSHLIGHEGPGSIMSCLKLKGWANELNAGSRTVCPGTPGVFHTVIRLTEDGLENYREIVKIFFQYISLLKETPPQEWIFQEQKGLADLSFKFRQKTPASLFTSKISSVMQTPLPRKWLLSGHSRKFSHDVSKLMLNYRLRKFDSDVIKKCLACLRPDNFRLMILSQTFPGNWDKKEKWYGTEYTYENIPADFLTEIKQAAESKASDRLPELHLPHTNQFIPTKLEVEKKVVKEVSLSPKLIRNVDLMRTWYKKDDQFWVPKANLFVSCRNTLINATAGYNLKARLYTDIVRDALEEYSYDAQLAGLDYSICCSLTGIEIAVSGYNDKLPVLLDKVLSTMKNLEVRPDRFEIIKERLLRNLKNLDYGQPFHQVSEYTRWMNSEKGYINEQMLAEIPHISSTEIQEFYPRILGQLHIETFVHGNIYKEDALRLSDLIEHTLKPRAFPKSELPITRSLIFPPGSNFMYRRPLKDPANVNNCIEYLLFIGDKSIRPLRVKTLLLDQITNEPAFDQLRSKEQLGYVVFSGARTTATTIGYRFIIQSERSPSYLETRIDSFLDSYKKTLENMDEADFENHKRSLITKRLEKSKNLNQESSRLWAHIESEYFDFEFAEKDAAEIRLLTKANMIEFFKHFIDPYSPQRSKLVVYLEAQTSVMESSTSNSGKEEDVNKLQNSLNIEGDSVAANPSLFDNGTTPYIITDVHEFKSKLPVSIGPQPVKHIREFEESESKL